MGQIVSVRKQAKKGKVKEQLEAKMLEDTMESCSMFSAVGSQSESKSIFKRVSLYSHTWKKS